MRRTQQLANLLLPFFALIWPWDVYGYVPLLDMQATTLVAGALIVLLALDMVRRPRPDIPFSLLWPSAAIATLALVASPPDGIGVAAAAVFFIAVAHFASDRRRAFQYLGLTFCSSVAVAGWNVLAPVLGAVPTARSYPLDMLELNLTFAHDVPSGGLTLIIAIFLGAALAGFARGRRRWAVAAATLLPTWALYTPARSIHSVYCALGQFGWWFKPLLSAPILQLAILALALWLVSRVAAVLVVSGREAPEERHRLLLIPLLGGAVAALVLCTPPRLGDASLLGLIAAYGWAWRRETQPAMPRPTLVGAAALAALLAVVNISYVFMANRYDSRNYEAMAARAMAAGRSDDARTVLRQLDHYANGEQRFHLWQARVSLALGEPLTSAAHFDAATNGAKGRRAVGLPAPTVAELDEFVVRMRDYASAHNTPLDLLAFARVLTVLDRTNLALATIRPPTAAVAPAQAAVESDTVLADAVARALGLESTPDALKQWPTEDLLKTLESWGAQVEHEPNGFGPKAIVAEVNVRNASVDVHIFENKSSQAVSTPCDFYPSEATWDRWVQPRDDSPSDWMVRWDECDGKYIDVSLTEDEPAVEVFQGKLIGSALPAAPAILVLLP